MAPNLWRDEQLVYRDDSVVRGGAGGVVQPPFFFFSEKCGSKQNVIDMLPRPLTHGYVSSSAY